MAACEFCHCRSPSLRRKFRRRARRWVTIQGEGQTMPITVYYATNRNETGTPAKPSFGPGFHAKGPHYLRFGSADVDPPSKPGDDYKVKSVYLAPEQLPGAGTKSKQTVLGSREIFEELRQKMKAQKTDLLLLIHGFASEFTTALERAAQGQPANG